MLMQEDICAGVRFLRPLRLPDASSLPRYFWDLDLLSPLPKSSSILRLIDCTFSARGWQRLLKLFESEPVSLDELRARQKRVEELGARPGLRRRFLLAGGGPKAFATETLERILETPVFPSHAQAWLRGMFVVQLALAAGMGLLGPKWASRILRRLFSLSMDAISSGRGRASISTGVVDSSRTQPNHSRASGTRKVAVSFKLRAFPIFIHVRRFFEARHARLIGSGRLKGYCPF